MSLLFETDKTGFPMVWVETVDAYVHWLPVTKIQFEHFITDRISPQFDERWYTDILNLNPRVSPRAAKAKNYWQLFLTGIKPDEAESYAEWCGDEYEIPTLDEWKKIYQFASALPVADKPFENLELKPLTLSVIKSLDDVRKSYEKTMAVQMYLRYGIMEWVHTNMRGQEWGGMGQCHSQFQSIMRPPDYGQPELPRAAETIRLHYYGFRLLRRR